jgi:putative spermidine/putrescine transport system substrate-binding protein
MSKNYPSRRKILKAGGAVASLIGMPALLRAEAKEIVIGGPAGAAKYFNSDEPEAHPSHQP